MIHLIWSGRGWLAPATVFASSLAMELTVEQIHQDPSYYQNHHWPFATVLVGSGAIVCSLGLLWKTEPSRRLIDQDSAGAVLQE